MTSSAYVIFDENGTVVAATVDKELAYQEADRQKGWSVKEVPLWS